MTIREKVALALHHARLEDDDVDIAINTFLQAAAEEGWHMRPDEATLSMQLAIRDMPPNEPSQTYRAMLAAAPKFEWDK